jgi:hypothetical protein
MSNKVAAWFIFAMSAAALPVPPPPSLSRAASGVDAARIDPGSANWENPRFAGPRASRGPFRRGPRPTGAEMGREDDEEARVVGEGH